jgi:hypothetical protein
MDIVQAMDGIVQDVMDNVQVIVQVIVVMTMHFARQDKVEQAVDVLIINKKKSKYIKIYLLFFLFNV